MNFKIISQNLFLQNLLLHYLQSSLRAAQKKFLNFNNSDFVVKKSPISKQNQIMSNIPQADTKAAHNREYLLYIHIPFCATLCPFCSFNRFLFESNTAKRYFKNLRAQLRQISTLGYDFKKVYIGGGTTTIEPNELARSIELIYEIFPNISELSCESDPAQLKNEVLEILQNRVHRLSVGVQSFNDEILRKTGRLKFGDGEKLRALLENAKGKIPILNIDLIFNFPNQSKEDLKKDLEIAISISPEQITLYPLMVSEITQKNISSTLGQFSEKNERSLYEFALDFLEQNGYFMQSGWSFAKQKQIIIDEYVLDRGEYVGAGSGAFSFIDDSLFVNSFDLGDYIKKVGNAQSGVVAARKMPKKAVWEYQLLLALFSNINGFYVKDLEREFAFSFASKIKLKFILWILQIFGALDSIKADSIESTLAQNSPQEQKEQKKSAKFLAPSKFGKYLFVSLLKEFYIGMDNVRSTARAELSDFGFLENKS